MPAATDAVACSPEASSTTASPDFQNDEERVASSSLKCVAKDDDARPVLGFDIDEVLFPFLEGFVGYFNEKNGANYKRSMFTSYTFHEVMEGMTESMMMTAVFEYFRSDLFKTLQPIEGSVEAVKELSKHFRIVAMTARQSMFEETTRQWLRTHFGDYIEDVVFGDHWMPEGSGVIPKSKREMCAEYGAVGFIDDNQKYCSEVAPLVPGKCILFNFNNANGWSKNFPGHEGVTVCASWEEVIRVFTRE